MLKLIFLINIILILFLSGCGKSIELSYTSNSEYINKNDNYKIVAYDRYSEEVKKRIETNFKNPDLKINNNSDKKIEIHSELTNFKNKKETVSNKTECSSILFDGKKEICLSYVNLKTLCLSKTVELISNINIDFKSFSVNSINTEEECEDMFVGEKKIYIKNEKKEQNILADIIYFEKKFPKKVKDPTPSFIENAEQIIEKLTPKQNHYNVDLIIFDESINKDDYKTIIELIANKKLDIAEDVLKKQIDSASKEFLLGVIYEARKDYDRSLVHYNKTYNLIKNKDYLEMLFDRINSVKMIQKVQTP